MDLLTEEVELVMHGHRSHEESLKTTTRGVVQQLQGKARLVLEPTITLLADISTKIQEPSGVQEYNIEG